MIGKIRVNLNFLIDSLLCVYIVSLYLFTYREGLNDISNLIAGILIIMIWFRNAVIRKKIKTSFYTTSFLVFVIVCYISSFYAISSETSLVMTRTLLLIWVLIFSIYNYIDDFKGVRKVINYYIVAGLLASLYILVTSDWSTIGRFGEQLGNVNSVGLMIGFAFIFTSYYISSEKKYSLIPIATIMLPVILITGSRKAIILISGAVLLMVVIRKGLVFKSRVLKTTIAIILVLLLIFVTFNVEPLYQILGVRLEGFIQLFVDPSEIDSSLNTRIYMLQSGIDYFLEKPFLGYGINNYRFLYAEEVYGIETYSHNNIIELLVGIGLIGTIIYHYNLLLLLFRGMKNYYKKLNTDIYLPVIVITIMYILLSPTMIFYYSKHINIILILLGVIVMNEKKLVK